ncbi:MAG: host attachment protein [Pseudotabrizicola sp.]|uniref:baeRF12 domain-containing protein n=1 Tax=Pseudotabrizicola sp. TaxID=2939647 RepID=UPI002722147D|nr:host attachment protein [Pseudotabrizicola sp.]MDO8882534.1 host attachment protein [Pseudotabrizicola sp.]MDP2083159.1 host attachment protein [Pseudotabrizicola sp.]MDZ7572577.1 host attachment protein [Pseudotabrizicola sp.]
MPMRTRDCWIVVVDGAGAMILENAGTVAAPDLRVIDRIETPRPEGPPDPALRAVQTGQSRPVEVSDRTRLAETAMIAMLMTRLTFAVRQSQMTRLAIAAPPHLLEAIRTRLDDNLRSRVAIMVPKTLTQHPLDKIVNLMAEAMQRAA